MTTITNTTFTLMSPTAVGKKSVEFAINGEAHRWLATEKRHSQAVLAQLIWVIYRGACNNPKPLSGLWTGGVWVLPEGGRMVDIDNARGIWNALIAAGWKVSP